MNASGPPSPATASSVASNSAPSPAGLSTAAAAERRAVDGPNEIVATPRSRWKTIGGLFLDPLVIILLFAAVVSGVLGDAVNSAIVTTIVLVSVAVNFVQNDRSQAAIEGLRASVQLFANAKRDGVFREIPRREVVVGDVVRLVAGDIVPADGTLLEARDLHLQEGALTGESLPVEKQVGGGDLGTVFLGTSVASGIGLARVTAIARNTAFGALAASLASRAPTTEFENGLRRFGALIVRVVFALVLFILVVSVALHRPPFASLLFAVALAVGLTPEFLPMITTVTLARAGVRMAKSRVVVKQLAAIQNLGSMDVLCSDKTGTLTRGTMELAASINAAGAPSLLPLAYGQANSRHETGIASPLDAAILAAPPAETPEILGAKRDEVPFDFERRCVSIVLEDPSHDGAILICKGAPEQLLALCTLTPEARAIAQAAHDVLAAAGNRMLGVAVRRLPRRDAYARSDEQELTLLGFLAFADPPRADAADVLRALRDLGVSVKILTGDSPLVAKHVCGAVGLDVTRIVTGEEVAAATDPALAALAEEVTLFARLSPAEKNRVVRALKGRGHVVGYLGDGINDAPSLHSADVGISVANAVDVARDAAQIILLDGTEERKEGDLPSGGLHVLHDGILEGRRAFGNVTKYLLMGTSSNFGNMFSMAVASVVLPFLPMLPLQILLNNLLYDFAQITIPTDTVDPAFLQKPRRWDIALIQRFMLWIGPISSLFDLATFWFLLRVMHADERLFHTGWFVESLATQTLVVFVIRGMSAGGAPGAVRARPSRPLVVSVLAVVAVAFALPFSPFAKVLGFVAMPPLLVAFVVAAIAAYLLLVAWVKGALFRRLFATAAPVLSSPM
jgi:Mg2+-importing ATPase